MTLRMPGIVKLASRMPPDASELRVVRIVRISGINVQADGGFNVKNVSKIGEVVLMKVGEQSRTRKRFYYRVRS